MITPLNAVIEAGVKLDLIQGLLLGNNNNKMPSLKEPLHFACRYAHSSVDVIEKLVQMDPDDEKLEQDEEQGHTTMPIHHLLRRTDIDKDRLMQSVEKFVDLSPKSLSIEDDTGKIPAMVALIYQRSTEIRDWLIAKDSSRIQ